MDPTPACRRPAAARLRRLCQKPPAGRSLIPPRLAPGACRAPPVPGRLRKGNVMTALWVHTPVAQAVGWALIHFLWEGAALAAVLAAALFLLRPSAARARYAAACLTLFAMPVAFAITLLILLPDRRAPRSPPFWPPRSSCSARPPLARAMPPPASHCSPCPWPSPSRCSSCCPATTSKP